MPPVSVEIKRSVKAGNDIVDVIASYIPVHESGKQVKALCPFHDDSRPSLQIDRNYQNYRCWACGASGDIFDFVMNFDKVSFPEALEMLATRAGIRLDSDTPDPEVRTKARMLECMAWAAEKYQHCLFEGEIAKVARDYLGQRRLAGATVRKFGLGFAPMAGDWLVRLAEAEGVPLDILKEVGLVAEREENRGYFDRFRDRVMFPIRDARGRYVGFGGRILPESPMAARAPKYYNSAETPLFNKSQLLYGLDLARQAGANDGTLAVVEGYTDVMMAHQSGLENVVATMGTALNSGHLSQIRRYASRVVLVFDNDAGGLSGVDRALELFVSNEIELAIALLPPGLDPCDLLAQPDGVDQFRQLIGNATDALNFKLEQLIKKEPGNGIEAAKRIIDNVLSVMALAPTMSNAESRMRQELITTRLAQRFNLKQETVWARLSELRVQTRYKPNANKPAPVGTSTPPPSGRPPAIERQLLELLLAEPELVAVAHASIPAEEIGHSGLRRMLQELYHAHTSGELPDFDALRVRMLDRPDLLRVANDLQMVGRHMTERPVWLQRLIAELAQRRTKAEAQHLKETLAAGVQGEQEVEILRRLQAKYRPAV